MNSCKTIFRDDGLDRRRWYGVCAKCGAKVLSHLKSSRAHVAAVDYVRQSGLRHRGAVKRCVERFDRCDEWHVEIGKCRCENEMGEKDLTCLDGVEQKPIFGKEAYRCDFLTRDGYANK